MVVRGAKWSEWEQKTIHGHAFSRVLIILKGVIYGDGVCR